jgi:hypothetical protein
MLLQRLPQILFFLPQPLSFMIGLINMGNFSMGKSILMALGLIVTLLLAGLCSGQGMGDGRGYDGTATSSVQSDQTTTIVPDFLSPYNPGRPEWDPYGPGTVSAGAMGIGAYNLQLESADPARESLIIKDPIKVSNQLYMQMGSQLTSQAQVPLGEPYIIWAKVAGKGSFRLYDYNNLVLNQGYISPGWYKIGGAYADVLGSHLYRFESAGLSSNNLSILANAGGYPTSFSLTGRVVDQSGAGMPGVSVILSNNEGGKFSTMTDSSGYYAMDVASGTYLVNAERSGFNFTPTNAHVWTGVVSAARPIVGYLAANPPFSGQI